MANGDLFSEQEKNRLLQERVGISNRLVDTIRGESNALEEQLKTLKFEVEERRSLRDLSRQLNRIAQEGAAISVNDLGTRKSESALQKEINKLTKVQKKLKLEIFSQTKKGGKINKDVAETLQQQLVASTFVKEEFKQIQKFSKGIGKNLTVSVTRNISSFLSYVPFLKSFGAPLEQAASAIEQAAIASEKARVNALQSGKGLTRENIKNIGLEKELGGATGKAARNRIKKLKIEKKVSFAYMEQLESIKQIFKLSGNITAGLLSASFFNSLNKVSQANVQLVRLVGESDASFLNLNKNLTTSVDLLEQAVSATEQFGLNAAFLLSDNNLSGATELAKLLGLSAEDSNNLALASDAFSRNLITSTDEAIAQVNALNASNRSAVSQKIAIQDAAQASSGLTIALKGSLSELTKAAAQARAFGISLQQAEKIADGLLDIENSLTKEFEAQSVLGIQTNFNRARGFALTDQMDKVIQEIVANEELLGKFLTGNRIEREVVADLVGLEVNELGKAILLQRGISDLTDEQVKRASGVTREQLMQLSATESIIKSTEKLTSMLAIGLEPMFRSLANNASVVFGLVGALAGLSLARLVLQIGQAAVGMGIIGAVTNPAGLLLGLGALVAIPALIGAGMGVSQMGDGIFAAGRGPVISTREGGLFQGTSNDDVLVGPGIARGRNAGLSKADIASIAPVISTREGGLSQGTSNDDVLVGPGLARGRNSGLSKADIASIAKAVRDGASEAQINLDGGRVSNRLQPALAVNTRKYSI